MLLYTPIYQQLTEGLRFPHERGTRPLYDPFLICRDMLKKQMGQLALKIFEQYKNSVETNHFLKCREIVILPKETKQIKYIQSYTWLYK